MVYKLLQVYKTELNLRNVIFKHFRWNLFMVHFIVLFIIFSLTITASIFYNNPAFLLFFTTIMITLPNLFKRIERERKRILNEYHHGLNYNEIRMRRLKKFLKEENIDHSREKINMLISLIEKQAQEQRVPFLVGRGVLAALLVPIWIQSISWVLNKQIESVEMAALFIMMLLVFIVLIWVFISFWKHIINDELINSDLNRFKMMANDLRELLFKE